MDWYPWYFTLYEQDTMHLTPYQDGCYRRLIDHYMKTRSPLPDNDAALARIIGDSLENWLAQASETVKAFFKQKNGKLLHKRCDMELDKQDRISKRLSESGKKGAESRKINNNKNKDLTSTASATLKPMLNCGLSTGQDRTGQDIREEDKSSSSPLPLTAEKSNEKIPMVKNKNSWDLDQAVMAWNELASRHGLAQIVRLTPQRKQKLIARLKDCGGISGWIAALEKVSKSDFCLGKRTDWKANFDFLMQENSFTKLLEGAYDNSQNGGRNATRSTRTNELNRATAEIFSEIDAGIFGDES